MAVRPSWEMGMSCGFKFIGLSVCVCVCGLNFRMGCLFRKIICRATAECKVVGIPNFYD